MTTNLALQVQDLRVTVQVSGVQLLKGLTLSLRAGERLTFVGESGSGKSILAQTVMGTLPQGLQASGSVQVWGHDTRGERQRTQQLWGKQVMMLPQEPWLSLNPLMRVQSQVIEAAHYAGQHPWPQAHRQADDALEQLGLSQAKMQWLHQISGGMAQRTALAATQLCGAQLLLADEPTKGLDTSMRNQVAQLLLAQQHGGKALLTITHDLDLAARLGGQIAVMLEGEIVEIGATESVLNAPQHNYTRQLIAAQPSRWQPLHQTTAINLPVVMQGQQLSKAYGAHTLFSSTDVSLRAGEVLAITGPSGCGKTTLGNILLGLVAPDTGQVTPTSNARPYQFQKLYQDPPSAFAPGLTMRTAINDVSKLHNLSTEKIAPLMQQLKLSPNLLSRKPSEISGGELQRFALLRLLLLKPVFIFADEPTSRLDPITQQSTMQLLCSAASEQFCAVLLVTHDADIAAKAAHRVSNISFAPSHASYAHA